MELETVSSVCNSTNSRDLNNSDQTSRTNAYIGQSKNNQLTQTERMPNNIYLRESANKFDWLKKDNSIQKRLYENKSKANDHFSDAEQDSFEKSIKLKTNTICNGRINQSSTEPSYAMEIYDNLINNLIFVYVGVKNEDPGLTYQLRQFLNQIVLHLMNFDTISTLLDSSSKDYFFKCLTKMQIMHKEKNFSELQQSQFKIKVQVHFHNIVLSMIQFVFPDLYFTFYQFNVFKKKATGTMATTTLQNKHNQFIKSEQFTNQQTVVKKSNTKKKKKMLDYNVSLDNPELIEMYQKQKAERSAFSVQLINKMSMNEFSAFSQYRHQTFINFKSKKTFKKCLYKIISNIESSQVIQDGLQQYQMRNENEISFFDNGLNCQNNEISFNQLSQYFIKNQLEFLNFILLRSIQKIVENIIRSRDSQHHQLHIITQELQANELNLQIQIALIELENKINEYKTKNKTSLNFMHFLLQGDSYQDQSRKAYKQIKRPLKQIFLSDIVTYQQELSQIMNSFNSNKITLVKTRKIFNQLNYEGQILLENYNLNDDTNNSVQKSNDYLFKIKAEDTMEINPGKQELNKRLINNWDTMPELRAAYKTRQKFEIHYFRAFQKLQEKQRLFIPGCKINFRTGYRTFLKFRMQGYSDALSLAKDFPVLFFEWFRIKQQL